MSRVLIAAAVALTFAAAPKLAVASEEGAAAGAVTGAVAGAIVGGPVGAVVGAVVGGVTVGVASGPSNSATPVEAAPGQRSAASPGTLPYEPETTGSVLETTCTRDARGIARCRRAVVR
jgi:hypothetical protein